MSLFHRSSSQQPLQCRRFIALMGDDNDARSKGSGKLSDTLAPTQCDALILRILTLALTAASICRAHWTRFPLVAAVGRFRRCMHANFLMSRLDGRLWFCVQSMGTKPAPRCATLWKNSHAYVTRECRGGAYLGLWNFPFFPAAPAILH